NGEGRHEAPEAVQVTDLGKHFPAAFRERVLELSRDILNGGELGKKALRAAAIRIRKQRVIEAEEPRDVPENVVREALHERARENEFALRLQGADRASAERVLRLREL